MRRRPGPSLQGARRGHGGVLSANSRHALVRTGIYLAALPLILLVYATKERALLTAAPIGLIGAGLVWLVGRDATRDRQRLLLYAGAVGAVMAELAWALGYWSTLPLVGGAALWLALYALSGIAEHALDATLDQKLTREFGAVALLGVLLVLVSQPWRAF